MRLSSASSRGGTPGCTGEFLRFCADFARSFYPTGGGNVGILISCCPRLEQILGVCSWSYNLVPRVFSPFCLAATWSPLMRRRDFQHGWRRKGCIRTKGTQGECLWFVSLLNYYIINDYWLVILFHVYFLINWLIVYTEHQWRCIENSRIYLHISILFYAWMIHI